MLNYSTTQFDQAADDEYSLLVDKNNMDKLVVDSLSKKKRRHEDKDQDPHARSDQGMKKRRIGKDAEPSMKSSKSKDLLKRADQKLYKFKEGDFSDLHLNDIEDMLLLIAQNKLFNLEGDVIVDFVTALKMFTQRIIVQNRVEDVQLAKELYTPTFDPPGVIYENKSKKKRLMRVDEVHKFCDGTLLSVRNILHQRLQNFKLGYNKDMTTREWTENDKRRTRIILNKIDDHLFKRRIMRSLKVLVGGRKTETEKRLLQRTA
ncbi:hypothetical protein Tco_1075275 [Tanacetum coccineum]